MSNDTKTLNVGELIDNGRLSAVQIATLVLCALITFIDGMDTQSIGIVSRDLFGALNLEMVGYPVIAAAGLAGAALGALTLGQLGDRFGRKRVLIAAALWFGVFTIATAWMPTYWPLFACRFVAGIGLGGAMPNVVALNAEYAPKRIRALMVTLQWSAFPAGGFLGGYAARWLLQHYQWESVFYFGGGTAIVIALLLWLWLPESLRYLISRNAPPADIYAVVQKIAPGESTAESRFVSIEEKTERANVGELFAAGRAPTTVLIWMVFAVSFSILVFTPLFAGLLLGGEGRFATPDIALIVARNNLGSMAGGVLAGYLIDRFGPYRVLTPAFVLGALLTAMIGLDGQSLDTVLLYSTIGGFFIGMGGNGSVAVCAAAYPTTLRATGMGWAVSMARVGQIATSLLMPPLIARGLGAEPIFMLVGGAALIAAAAMAGLKFARKN